MTTCVFKNTYWESPEFMKLSLHTSAIISTPISLLGFYMIIFKTPKPMKSAKWYIFNVHISIVLLDFCFCFLCTPFFLFPAVAGIGLGVFQYFGVPVIIQTISGIVSIAFTTFAILALFESRFYIVCDFPGKKYWKFWRHAWLYGHYLYFIFAAFLFYFSVPDLEMALRKLMKNIPCLPDNLKSAPIFVFAERMGFQVAMILSTGLMVSVELIVLCLLLVNDISRKLENPRKSRRTVEIQKVFLTALFLQTAVPLIFMLIPLLCMYYTIISNYYNQAFTNIGMAFLSTHGFISTIVMIMVHRPYREAFFDLIGKTKKVEPTEVSLRTSRIDAIKY